MFKVLLYLWIFLTITLLAAIIRYIYRWTLGILHKRRQLHQSIAAGDFATAGENETLLADEEEFIDESYRSSNDTFVLQENIVILRDDESEIQEEIHSVESTIVNELLEDDTIVESIEIEEVSASEMPAYDGEHTIPHEDSVEDIFDTDDLVTDTDGVTETAVVLDETINDEENTGESLGEKSDVEHAQGEQYMPPIQADAPLQQRPTYTPESSATFVELPKDLDANRNIAQGHSRDDIVRDKFEKHIEKIRYEATVLKQRNDLLGYEKKLVEGLTLLPHDQPLQKQLADLYFQQGKFKKALSLLKKILAIDPENHVALWQLGEITLQDGNAEDAYMYFLQAYTLCDDNPKYCLSLAQRHYDQEQYEQALPLMEKLVKLRPKNIDYWVSLAHVQLKLHLNAEAKQSLLNAQEIEPMNLTLKQYLKAF